MLRKWSYLTAAALLLTAAGCGGGGDQPGGGQQAAGIDTLGTSYIQPQHQGFMLIRPKQIIESPVVKSLVDLVPEGEDPFGEIQDQLGIDPRIIETLVLIGGGKAQAIRDAADKVAQGDVPKDETKDISGCIVIHGSEPIEPALKSHPGLKNHQETKHGNATYLKSPDDSAPSVYFIDAQTVLLAADHEIGNFIDHPPAAGPLHEKVGKADLNHDIVGLGVTGELASLMENPPGVVPVQTKAILQLLADVQSGDLVIDVGSAPAFRCTMNFNQAAVADKFQKQVSAFVDLGKTMVLFSLPEADFPPEVDKTAVVELVTETVNTLAVTRDEQVVTIQAATPKDFQPRLEEVLPGFVAAARNSGREAKARNNLKQLGLALQTYHDVHGRFPTDVVSADGKPLLSWRVELLPYLYAEQGFEELRRDEPWDSEHNAKILAKMPEVFALGVDAAGGKTDVLAPKGKGTWIASDKPVAITDVADGTSNTILAVQVQPEHAVPWAKPGDYEFDASNPAAGLGSSADAKNVPVLFVDTVVLSIKKSLMPEQWIALFTYGGGEVIDFLDRPPMAAGFDFGEPAQAAPAQPANNP